MMHPLLGLSYEYEKRREKNRVISKSNNNNQVIIEGSSKLDTHSVDK